MDKHSLVADSRSRSPLLVGRSFLVTMPILVPSLYGIHVMESMRPSSQLLVRRFKEVQKG